jgi:hypothetical protein
VPCPWTPLEAAVWVDGAPADETGTVTATLEPPPRTTTLTFVAHVNYARFQCRWEFERGGVVRIPMGTWGTLEDGSAYGCKVGHTLHGATGDREVQLTVTDDHGHSATAAVILQVVAR